MILDRILQLSPAATDDFWFSSYSAKTRAGVEVDESAALTFSACWAATRLLSGTGAYLPLNLQVKSGSGGSIIAESERLHSLLHDAPNPEMSSMMWRATKLGQQINWGNCFSEIERTPRGEIAALWPIHASRVSLKNDGTQLFYEVRNNAGPATHLAYSEVFHVPSMMSDDGRWGKGVIRNARETIGHALATERYGSNWFGSGGRPAAVLKHPSKMDKEARANLRNEWNAIYGGPDNPNRVAVLWEKMEYQAITSDPEDSQFLTARQHNIEEIARWYGVPPHLIGHLLRSTNNNIEQQGIEFVKYSLLPWLKMWEQEIWRKLLTPEQRAAGYYAKFAVDALERGDAISRTTALSQQFFNGALTLNQWMALEDRDPIGPLGDVHFLQSAMVTLERAVEGEPQTEPPQNEPAGDERESQQAAIREAAIDVLAEIVRVMLERESAAATHAAKKPAQFLNWMDEFYEDHAVRMRKALANPVRTCILASGAARNAEEVLAAAVSAHIESSRKLLLSAAECQPESLATKVDGCVSSWSRNEITDLVRGKT